LKKNSFYFFAILAILVYVFSMYFYYGKSQQDAINSAIHTTNDFLRNNQAAKIFFNEEQQEKLESLRVTDVKNAFSPEVYSCTYASKKINEYYNKIRKKDNLPPIPVSFVAANPKNINNKATSKELEILEKFQRHQATSYHEILDNYDGTKTLYYALPSQELVKSCLECHGAPSQAPLAIIKEYGSRNGFHHKIGEIRSFVKVLMPLEKHLKDAEDLFLTKAIASLLIILSILIPMFIFMRKSQNETKKFQAVIDTLSEIVILRTKQELISVNKSFLKFFNVKNIKEFEQKFKCLSSHFQAGDDSVELDLKNLDENVIQKLNALDKTDRIIKMANYKDELKTLTIKIYKLDEIKDEYVIVLSDITQLQQKADMLEKKANIDSLTQIYTRQRFEELYSLELHRSQRYINSLSILFLDIDHFKKINDVYGHDIGDATLKTFASLISSTIREYDVFGRWGGEEFILMLPQTDVNVAFKIAEKLRKLIETYKFDKLKNITCSIGISMLQKDDDYHSLIKRADNALYKAKNTGRNKTIIDF